MTENLHKKIQLNDSLLALENEKQINDATNERQRLINRKDAIEDTLHRLQNAYVQEADGTGGSGQRGIEELTQLKMNAFDQVRNQFGPEVLQLERKIAAQDDILTYAKAIWNKRDRIMQRQRQRIWVFWKETKHCLICRVKKAVCSGVVC